MIAPWSRPSPAARISRSNHAWPALKRQAGDLAIAVAPRPRSERGQKRRKFQSATAGRSPRSGILSRRRSPAGSDKAAVHIAVAHIAAEYLAAAHIVAAAHNRNWDSHSAAE